MTKREGKPFVLCVDLDNVVANYTDAFRTVVATEKGVDPSSIGEQTIWNFTENESWHINTISEFIELHQIGVSRYQMFATMKEIADASDVLWRLNDEGVWIRLVTHRLFEHGTHDIAVSDTVRWLQQSRQDGRPRIPYRDMCFIGDKAEVSGDLYIDDAPHNVENLRAAGIPAMVFSQPYNSSIEGLRADNWVSVYEQVSEMLAAGEYNPV